ncbi:MAG: methyl-accepting chemotaxis protein [Clostridiales bacterium]|jgi:methyl-accepting chemotaxis protein|nr:methyl-accepting chemotaxis protein [Clostridiales bacterium]MDK2934038.1 methyl-accepting chemotaxis protein [Clostridiales bacterium]
MGILQRFNWNNLKIGWKYAVALLLTVVFFLGSMGIVYNFLSVVNNDVKFIKEAGDDAVEITEMIALFNELDVQVSDYIIFQTPQIIQDFEENIKKFDEQLANIHSNIHIKNSEDIFAKIRENNQQINDIFIKEIVPKVSRHLVTEYVIARKKLTGIRLENIGLLEEVQGLLKANRQAVITNTQEHLLGTILVLLISIAVSAVLGLAIMFVISRMIQRNLNKVINISDQVANGNLAIAQLNYNGTDEIGQLSKSISIMVDNLRDITQRIFTASDEVKIQSEKLTQSSHEVKQGSEQIALTMEQLAAGTQEQASTATNIANVLDKLNERILQANKESDDLKKSAHGLLDMSNKGNSLMENSIHQMDAITGIVQNSVASVKSLDKKSQEISHLIQIINNIAEQTNLLALNAAIEAARAGESGLGFAVVADEIRKLAEQVGNSVADITDIIIGIQEESKKVVDGLLKGYKQVEVGTNHIKDTGKTFADINSEVTQVVNRISNIAQSLQEVAKSSEDINSSVEQIASISEETAAGVEEASASVQQQHNSMETIAENAQVLLKLAEDLKSTISTFKR